MLYTTKVVLLIYIAGMIIAGVMSTTTTTPASTDPNCACANKPATTTVVPHPLLSNALGALLLAYIAARYAFADQIKTWSYNLESARNDCKTVMDFKPVAVKETDAQ